MRLSLLVSCRGGQGPCGPNTGPAKRRRQPRCVGDMACLVFADRDRGGPGFILRRDDSAVLCFLGRTMLVDPNQSFHNHLSLQCDYQTHKEKLEPFVLGGRCFFSEISFPRRKALLN